MFSIKEQIDNSRIEVLIRLFEKEEGRKATPAEIYAIKMAYKFINADYYGE